MFDVKVDEKKKLVTITAPLTGGTSKSGKMNALASTGGFATLESEHNGKSIKLNLFVGTKVD